MADFLTPAPLAPAGPGQNVEWYTGGGAPTGVQMGGYDAAGYAAGGYEGQMSSGPIGGTGGGFSGNSFDDEPPLLEELGIDVGAIFTKVRGVLLFKMRHDHMADLDLGGPLVFVLGLASLHLLNGKLHFGVILGWSVVGSAAMWHVTNMLSGIDSSSKINLYDTCCLMGYGMIPMCVFAALDLVIPKGAFLLALAFIFVVWCAAVSTKMFMIQTPSLLDHRILVAYPCLLFYSAFALLSFY